MASEKVFVDSRIPAGGAEPDVWWGVGTDDPVLWAKPLVYVAPSLTLDEYVWTHLVKHQGAVDAARLRRELDDELDEVDCPRRAAPPR